MRREHRIGCSFDPLISTQPLAKQMLPERSYDSCIAVVTISKAKTHFRGLGLKEGAVFELHERKWHFGGLEALATFPIREKMSRYSVKPPLHGSRVPRLIIFGRAKIGVKASLGEAA